MRKILNLNKGWAFAKQETSNEWEQVDLPHTWNAIDGANGFNYYKGECCYKKELVLDPRDAGKKFYIEFMGANSVADVYVNGTHLGQHRGGFSTFRFDATDALKISKANLIEVKVDNTVVEDVYPQMADFTFFGGLYRDVNLVVCSPVHVELMDAGAAGVYVIQDQVSEESAKLTVKVKTVNESDESRKVRVWTQLIDAAGLVVAYTGKDLMLEAGEKAENLCPIEIESPVLWNGSENPYLYRVCVALESFNEVIDEVTVETGLRYFEVDADKGFLLNGKPHRLFGVSRHQDRIDMGWAITHKEHEEDMALIKEVGANSIRLAHYQHDQYFYDLCDKEGMVVWAEIPFISIMSKTELEGINPKQQMVELIRQNFNHPSIFFWGIQNEIQIGGDRPEIRRLCRELNALTKQEDPTRLSTMANVMFVEDEDEYNSMTDIIGYNKYYGWYQGKSEDFAPWLDGFRKVNPKAKLAISEYGAEGILQYHSETPQIKDYTEEYHALYHETVWKIFEKREYLWATYVWNMFDFGANIRDEGGVKGRNNKGLVTYDRKIKKDAFYMYKAHWSKDAFVHITSKRFIERAQEAIDIKIYTNCDSVDLIVNGQLIGSATGEDHVVVFKAVVLEMGPNKIEVAARTNDGEIIYRDIASFARVAQPNESYKAPEQKGGVVANWFDMPDLTEMDVVIEDIVIADDVFSTKQPIGILYKNEETREILIRYLGDVSEKPMFGMMEGMTLNALSEMEPELFDEKVMYLLNRELSKITR